MGQEIEKRERYCQAQLPRTLTIEKRNARRSSLLDVTVGGTRKTKTVLVCLCANERFSSFYFFCSRSVCFYVLNAAMGHYESVVL